MNGSGRGVKRQLIAVLVCATALAACGGDDAAETTTTTTVAPTTSSTTTTTALTTTVPLSTTTTERLPATDTTYVVQADLKHMGYFEGVIDGIAGPETKAALAKFQSDAGIEADGEFGPQTDAAMVPVLTDDPTYIEIVQEELTERELYTGPIDGDFGAGTERALKNAQEECEIEQTGTLEIATRLCLFAP